MNDSRTPLTVGAGFLMCVLVAAAACGTSGHPAATTTTQAEATVIVVPGYYGTKLARASDGAVVWIDTWEALFRSRSLRLPLPGMGFEEAVPLNADGLLEKIRVIPLIYAVEGYGSLMEALLEPRAQLGNVVAHTYDWRGDLMDAVRRLADLVSRLRKEQRPVGIVAHSTGGLITSYYLRYGAQDPDIAVETWDGAKQIDAVVLAGVPFRGTMTAFRNMQYGVKIGLNKSLLDQKAVASFPSNYYLLPAAELDSLLTPTGRRLDGAIRDRRNWIDHGWGLLKDSDPLPQDIKDRRADYTGRWLARSRRFSELILAPAGSTRPRAIPLLYLTGKGSPTLATGVLLEESKKPDRVVFDEESFSKRLPEMDSDVLMEDGDGTATRRSALLPEAFEQRLRVTRRDMERDHAELVSAPGLQRNIVDFLGDAVERRAPSSR